MFAVYHVVIVSDRISQKATERMVCCIYALLLSPVLMLLNNTFCFDTKDIQMQHVNCVLFHNKIKLGLFFLSFSRTTRDCVPFGLKTIWGIESRSIFFAWNTLFYGFPHGALPVYGVAIPELDMGPFLLTQSNPIHQLMDRIQSNSKIAVIKSNS